MTPLASESGSRILKGDQGTGRGDEDVRRGRPHPLILKRRFGGHSEFTVPSPFYHPPPHGRGDEDVAPRLQVIPIQKESDGFCHELMALSVQVLVRG